MGRRRGANGAFGGRGLILACVGLLALAFAPFALAKHAGQLDPSFGAVSTLPAGHHGHAWAVAVGKKDKPVAAGLSGGGFGVVRYTRHGEVDPAFGNDGVQTQFGDGTSEAFAVDVGKNGAVVAAGRACHPSGCNFALAKYTSDGQLDTSFGGDGRVELRFGADENTATSVAFTKEGKILVAGYRCVASKSCDFALTKLLPNGNPDPTFGGSSSGKVVTRFEDKSGDPINATASAIAIDSRGRIAVGGSGSLRREVLALYKPGGHLAHSFGHDGKVVKNLPHLGAIEGVAVDAKDKIVAVGFDKKKLGSRWALARFGKDGGVDRSFGNDGSVVTGIPGSNGAQVEARALAIDSKNRIVVAGLPFFSLARYQPNGKLNKSFGHDGRVTKKLGGSALGMAIDSRNRPVVAGINPGQFLVARFLG